VDFEYSSRTQALLKRVDAFMDEWVYPNEEKFHQEVATGDRWQPTKIMESLKLEARKVGLWNLFLPESELGAGLTNLEYAPLCERMGRVEWSPEVFNCSAPDTGNMEVFVRYGTPAQKKEWLEPLMDGRIRSCFAMTEPDVGSSDATNIRSTIIVRVTNTSLTAASGGLQALWTHAARSLSSWARVTRTTLIDTDASR
jgi:acyl-CoA dehydrogenase